MISMEEKIAIVIPAYKCRFLRQTLDSIVVQTCRSFTVYIGDDASPQNLKEIVSDYADKMNIVYRRFDTNTRVRDKKSLVKVGNLVKNLYLYR